jgi:hypothetical protein
MFTVGRSTVRRRVERRVGDRPGKVIGPAPQQFALIELAVPLPRYAGPTESVDG